MFVSINNKKDIFVFKKNENKYKINFTEKFNKTCSDEK